MTTRSSSVPAHLAAGTTDADVVAKFFRALGDPTRLRLLEFLLKGEHTVSECVTHVGLSQGRVSIHLGCLADCGYIAPRRAGRWCYYRVTDPRVAELVVLATSFATDNCSALAACHQIDPDHHGGTVSRPHPQRSTLRSLNR